MMKYECLKWAQIYSDIPLFPQNYFQLQTGPGIRRGTLVSTPNILFEFKCVGSVFAALWFCCYSPSLERSSQSASKPWWNQNFRVQKTPFFFLETKPAGRWGKWFVSWVNQGSALRQGKLSLVIWVLVAQTFPRTDFGLKSAFQSTAGSGLLALRHFNFLSLEIN